MRSLLKAVFASALVVGGVAVAAAPAQAAGEDFCPDRYICIYANANWSGKIASWGGGETGNHSFPANRASSWQNHSSYNWCAYDQGTLPDALMYRMPAPQSDNFVPAYTNDRADYAKRC